MSSVVWYNGQERGQMSGHSKWSTIKHKKAALDAKRSKEFAIVSKMITVAVAAGGSGEVENNPRLRLALDKARAANMPNVNVQKAIDKGLGKGAGGEIVEMVYEGYGPGGVGFLVKVLTDNRNRAASEIKSVFEKSGGSLAGPGAAAFLFEREGEGWRGKVPVQVDEGAKLKVMELIEKLVEHDDVASVVTNLG